MTDLCALTIGEAGSLLAARHISPKEYVAAHLDRIARVDPHLNAFIEVRADEAMREASQAEAEINTRGRRGTLHGVPIAIKDIIDVEGMATTAHSRIAASRRAQSDADVVRRLRDAGAIIIGKTALHEFATGGPSFDLPWPPARNPWLLSHHPGGSSSGSAVAVAARMAPGAIGTDTAGSVRHPATACGMVGLKPTYGVVSRRGVFPLSFSLDHVGPLARTVADCTAIYRAIVGHDPLDPTSTTHRGVEESPEAGIRGLRLGVLQEFGERADPEIRAAFDSALTVLKDLGAQIVPLDILPLDIYAGCGRLIIQAESYAVHEEWLATRHREYGKRTRTRLLAGGLVDAASYIKAQQLRRRLQQDFLQAMQGVDAAVCVSSLALPCQIDDETEIDSTYDRQARTPFNVTGTPAISIPIGFASNGLPIGMQVAGRSFDEAMILRVAGAYEAATAWHKIEPALPDITR